MGVWVQKNYGGGKTSSYYRVGTTAGPVLSDTVTKFAVKAIQVELRYFGYKGTRTDGVFDLSTDKDVRSFQNSKGLVADGIVGPNTAKALFGHRIMVEQDNFNIPRDYLFGLIDLESAFDPGAVGANGYDSGLVQINLDPVNGHGNEITQAQAFDPAFAVHYTAQRISDAYDAFATKLDDLIWKLAVAQHNSPLNAKTWVEAALRVPPGAVDSTGEDRILSSVKYVGLIDDRNP